MKITLNEREIDIIQKYIDEYGYMTLEKALDEILQWYERLAHLGSRYKEEKENE